MGRSEPKRQPYHGISWHTKNRRWRVKIYYNRRHLNFGHYTDPRLAAAVYDIAARVLHGPDATLNWNDTQPQPAERPYAESLVGQWLRRFKNAGFLD